MREEGYNYSCGIFRQFHKVVIRQCMEDLGKRNPGSLEGGRACVRSHYVEGTTEHVSARPGTRPGTNAPAKKYTCL